MRKLFTCLPALLIVLFTAAQTDKGSVSVTVQGQGKSLEGATVELLRAKDSALSKTGLTDKSGTAFIGGVHAGEYLVRISMSGYDTYRSGKITVTGGQQLQVPSVNLETAIASLQGVTVTARKPFIQKLADRIVVNVENSIVSAGSTAFDVMERAPGVIIDGNDAISLRGRGGVIIMIDGKPSPMSGADLVNYLRAMPSNAIERIDIITNPSAKYEAAGNSGIIDIRLKKDQRFGANGTLTAGFGHGVYPKANAGGNFNYRNKKVNVFGSYNYTYRENLNHLVINRNFFTNGVRTGADFKDNYAFMPMSNHSQRIGADFFPGKKTIIGVVVSANRTDWKRRSDNNTLKVDANGDPLRKFYSLGTNNDDNQNAVANFNIKHSLNDKGRELSADIDYGIFQSNSLTRTATEFLNLSGNKTAPDDILDGDQRGELVLRTGKVDFVNPVKGGRFEAGYRTSHVSSDNNAKFFNVTSSGSTVDAGKTNHFFYNEYNNAGYVNYSRELKKFSIQGGLRGEHTSLKTRQVKGDLRFNRDYFLLFPSAFFNYKLTDNKTIGLSVSRRIDRPGYGQLNPFLFQIDATIYATGDPLLRPQMTWSYEGSYTVKNMSFTLGYSHTKDPQNMLLARILDVIPNFQIPPDKDSNITVQIPVNLGSSDYLGLSATTPIRINSWWNMINSVNVFYNHVNGNLAGVAVSNGGPAANIRTNNTFTFKKGWTAEFIANLNTGGRSGYNFSQPSWGIATGVQKTVLKNKGTVRFNMTDIFWTNLPRATITYPGRYQEKWRAFRESRVGTLSFTYRFGSNKVQGERKRRTGSEEERQRAGG